MNRSNNIYNMFGLASVIAVAAIGGAAIGILIDNNPVISIPLAFAYGLFVPTIVDFLFQLWAKDDGKT